MSNVFIYIKKVLSKWVILLGFLPFIYGYLQAYFPDPIKSFQFPLNILYYFIPIGIFVATYQVWLEQKKENDEIKAKNTKFKVHPKLTKVSVEKHIQEIEKEIEEYNVKRAEIPDLASPFSGFFNPDLIFGNKSPDRDTYTEWIGMLDSYKKDVQNFRDRYKKLLCFNIKIEANQFDENIDVEVTIKSKAKFLKSFISEYPNYPITKGTSLLGAWNIGDLTVPKIDKSEPYRTNIYEEDSFAQCNLKYIKKDNPAYFSNHSLFLICYEDSVQVEVTINSKNSNGVKVFTYDIKLSDIIHHTESVDLEEFKKFLS
jgi:hypothetical protein